MNPAQGHAPTGIGFSAPRIARNTAARLLTVVVGQGSKGIVAIVVARELGAAAFGTFSVVWTVASIAAYYGSLGIDNLLTRELSRRDPLIDMRRAVPLVSSLGLFTAVALVVGAFAFTDGALTALAFIAAAPYVALTAPSLVLISTFNARERMEIESIVETIEGGVALVVALVALAFGGGIIGVLAALSLGRCIGVTASLLLHLRLPSLPVTQGNVEWARVLRASLPMGGVRLFTAAFQRADIVILGFVVSATQVGLYSSAAIAVLLVVDGLSEMGRAAYPAFSRASGSDDPELRDAFALIWKTQLYLALAAAAGLIALATPLARGIFGDEFAAAGPLLAVLSLSLVLRVLGNLGGISLYAVDRQVHRLRAIAIATAFKIALLVGLVPFFGLWGAAIAAVAADVVYIGVMMWFVRAFRPKLSMGWLPAGTTAMLVGGSSWLTPGPTVVRVSVGVLVFASVVGLASGRNLVSKFKTITSESSLPESVQIGPIRVRMRGHADLSRSVIARSLAQLPPPSAASTTELTVVFKEGVTPVGARIYGFPLHSACGLLFPVDHTGKSARLPLAALDRKAIVIDPYLDTDIYQSWIQLPVLRMVLQQYGWCLARLTVVEMHGRRVAMVARSTMGKTRLALTLLQRGATFIGDDWVALGPEGVAPACSLVVVRDQSRAALGRFALADHVRAAGRKLLGYFADWVRSWRKLSLALHHAESLVWRWGTGVTDVQTLLPNVTIAHTTAPVDLVVVLDGDGNQEDTLSIEALAEVIASRAIADLPSATAIEAVYRAGNPGSRRVIMPKIEDEMPLIAAALRDAQIEVVAIDGLAVTVEHVASQIEHWCDQPPVAAAHE